MCEARGCCFDSSIKGTKWCFKEAESKYSVGRNNLNVKSVVTSENIKLGFQFAMTIKT